MRKEYRQFLTESAKRRAKARKLREQGKDYTEIGEILGITRQRAWQIARPMLQRTMPQPRRMDDDMQRGAVG